MNRLILIIIISCCSVNLLQGQSNHKKITEQLNRADELLKKYYDGGKQDAKLIENALNTLKKATPKAEKAKIDTLITRSYKLLGDCFILKGWKPEAVYYYSRVYDIQCPERLPVCKANYYHDISCVYADIEDTTGQNWEEYYCYADLAIKTYIDNNDWLGAYYVLDNTWRRLGAYAPLTQKLYYDYGEKVKENLADTLSLIVHVSHHLAVKEVVKQYDTRSSYELIEITNKFHAENNDFNKELPIADAYYHLASALMGYNQDLSIEYYSKAAYLWRKNNLFRAAYDAYLRISQSSELSLYCKNNGAYIDSMELVVQGGFEQKNIIVDNDWLSAFYNSKGVYYLYCHEYDSATSYFSKALKLNIQYEEQRLYPNYNIFYMYAVQYPSNIDSLAKGLTYLEKSAKSAENINHSSWYTKALSNAKASYYLDFLLVNKAFPSPNSNLGQNKPIIKDTVDIKLNIRSYLTYLDSLPSSPYVAFSRIDRAIKAARKNKDSYYEALLLNLGMAYALKNNVLTRKKEYEQQLTSVTFQGIDTSSLEIAKLLVQNIYSEASFLSGDNKLDVVLDSLENFYIKHCHRNGGGNEFNGDLSELSQLLNQLDEETKFYKKEIDKQSNYLNNLNSLEGYISHYLDVQDYENAANLILSVGEMLDKTGWFSLADKHYQMIAKSPQLFGQLSDKDKNVFFKGIFYDETTSGVFYDNGIADSLIHLIIPQIENGKLPIELFISFTRDQYTKYEHSVEKNQNTFRLQYITKYSEQYLFEKVTYSFSDTSRIFLFGEENDKYYKELFQYLVLANYLLGNDNEIEDLVTWYKGIDEKLPFTYLNETVVYLTAVANAHYNVHKTDISKFYSERALKYLTERGNDYLNINDNERLDLTVSNYYNLGRISAKRKDFPNAFLQLEKMSKYRNEKTNLKEKNLAHQIIFDKYSKLEKFSSPKSGFVSDVETYQKLFPNIEDVLFLVPDIFDDYELEAKLREEVEKTKSNEERLRKIAQAEADTARAAKAREELANKRITEANINLNRTVDEKTELSNTLANRNRWLIVAIIVILILFTIISVYATRLNRSRRALNKANQELEKSQEKLAIQLRKVERLNNDLTLTIQDTDHRVGNSWQNAINELEEYSEKTSNSIAQKIIKRGVLILASHAKVHEHLRDVEIAKGVVNIQKPIDSIIKAHIQNFQENIPNLSSNIKITSISLPARKAIAITRIVNEMVLNALKHAYEGIKNPLLDISFSRNTELMTLEVKDNGIGYSNDMNSSFGLLQLQKEAKKLNGQIDKIATSKGTHYKLTFNLY